MRLAYAFLLYKQPQLFGRILRALYHPDDFFALHIDLKSPPEYHRAIADLATGKPNIRIIPSRRVTWGGWSLTQATLDAFDALLDMGPWDFAFNLSGQDYPLKSRREMIAQLAPHAGKNFVEVNPLDHRPKVRMDRLERYHVELRPRVYRLPFIRRRPPLHYTPYWGSFWVTLTRDFTEYVTRDPTLNPVRRFFRHSLLGDEYFFQMTAMNSPRFKDSVIPQNLRHIHWPTDEHGHELEHPSTLTLNDLPSLTANPHALFARKFDDSVDPQILDELDRQRARQH